MPLWIRIALALYGIVCVAALALAVVGTQGLLGMEPDAFAGVFAIVLALPWSSLLPEIGGPMAYLGALAVCMLLNGAIVAGLGAFLRRRRTA